MSDLIERQAAIAAVIKLCDHYTSTKSVTHPHIDFIIEEINAIPAADPVKHGRWEQNTVDYPYAIKGTYCSECGFNWSQSLAAVIRSNYCPNCGARMDGEKE